VTTPTVVVVGDANPDLILAGDVVPRFGQAEQLLDSASLVLGGSGAIVACGLARLGVPTALVAVVGDDVYGDFVRDSLRTAGVDLRWLATDRSTPTGLSVILSGDDRAILTLPGTIAITDARALPSYDDLAGVRHVHSASMFLLTALAPVLPAWLGSVRGRGISTSVDTNWDPQETWQVAREVIADADVFLPNVAELLAVTGLTDVEAAGSAIAAAGTSVALKNGAAGGIVWTPDGGRATADVVPVDVVDTTGAGDSFDAGFLAAYVDGHPQAECLRQAVAAGSLSTRAAGGTASQPTADELARALSVSP